RVPSYARRRCAPLHRLRAAALYGEGLDAARRHHVAGWQPPAPGDAESHRLSAHSSRPDLPRSRLASAVTPRSISDLEVPCHEEGSGLAARSEAGLAGLGDHPRGPEQVAERLSKAAVGPKKPGEPVAEPVPRIAAARAGRCQEE